MTDITDEMIEAAAEQIYGGPHHRYKAEDGGDLVEYTVAWNEVTEKLGIGERVAYLRQARRILEAALAERMVVELPAPNTTDSEGDPAWSVSGVIADGPDDVVAYVHQGLPRVSAIGAPDEPGAVEAYALTLLAAAREARRLASRNHKNL